MINKVMNDYIDIILEHNCGNICNLMKFRIGYKNSVMMFYQRTICFMYYYIQYKE